MLRSMFEDTHEDNQRWSLTQHVTQTRLNEYNHFIRSLNSLSTNKCRTDRFKNSFFFQIQLRLLMVNSAGET